ncbi:MAG TPA: tyrosine-protein phosphatase [Acidimicrobiales bacterium]|nr:tyrosine-protein phosphatase [Acidimicrobiales bacterium]
MNRDTAVLPLTGAMNCRDLGGYPTREGRHIRTNAIFRSDRLSDLTEDDQEELASYGIRTVVDFRTSAEAQRDVSRLWGTVTTHAPLPIGDEIAQQTEFVDRIRSGEITSVSVAEVADSYIEMLSDSGHQFVSFLELAADVDCWPLLFHCTAGKDRTGIAAALILELCGVERDLVLDDYELTNTLRSERRIEHLRPSLEEAGADIDAIRPALSAPRPAMEQTLTHLDNAHGGVEQFLVEHLGIHSDTIVALRLNLLV